jgi:hypothetical protein
MPLLIKIEQAKQMLSKAWLRGLIRTNDIVNSDG